MTGALLRNRIRATLHRYKSLDLSERVQLALILILLATMSGYWVISLASRPLDLGNASDIRAAIRVEAYRIGVLLAALVAFSSFGVLWRSQDIEVLNRLPIAPRSIFAYRLTITLFRNLPALALAIFGFVPCFWRGYPGPGLEAILHLLLVYGATAVCGMAWHMFAGRSVVSPAYSRLKHYLAGSMVLPDRTLLLYSPFLAAASGFGLGLLALVGQSAITRGEWLSGMAGIVLAVVCLWLTFTATRRSFEHSYYQALAALADGELLGEISESAPAAEFLGKWYVDRLPIRFRPLVDRDLKQAWRRSRLDHFALLTLAAAPALGALRWGPQMLGGGWLWPAVELPVLLAAAQAFRLTRESSDAPWLWLSLPLSLPEQYSGRLLAVLFFPLVLSPLLLLTVIWSGGNWGFAMFLLAMSALGASAAALNLALTFFTQHRLGGIVYIVGSAVIVLASKERPVFAALFLSLAGVVTLFPVRNLWMRLARAEQIV